MDGVKVRKSDNLQRIDYIDTLRGLCMLLIVWVHTDHPDFMNYIYYNATLFFVSGLVFKPIVEWKVFFRKKFYTLFVPFVFFYLLYYAFLLVLNYAKYKEVSADILYSVFDVFGWYSEAGGYVCNYPLWFIWALFWIQLITNVMDKILKHRLLILVIAFIVSSIGIVYVNHVPTPFMIGRSFTFLIYYVVGYVFSRTFIEYRNPIILMIISLIIFVLLRILRQKFSYEIMDCFEFVTLSIVLLMFCKLLVDKPLVPIFTYFGIHSLIVFGMHDMYLTIFRIMTINSIGDMNVMLGFINMILTLLIMVPTIVFINKYIPYCVGKGLRT